MRRWRALPVAGRLFESARWLEHERCFQWVDILTAKLFRWFPDTDALHCVKTGFEFLSLATPSQTPEVQFLAGRDTVYRYHWGGEPAPFAVLEVGAFARLNDGIVDGHGRLWIGSMGLAPDKRAPLGKLWRIDEGGSVTELLSGLGISNGIAWAPADASAQALRGRTGFHVDSLVGTLYCLTDEDESLSRREALKLSGAVEPDGIVLADGIVWIALWGGAALGRFDPATGHYSELALPADRPSSLAMSSELVLVTTAGRGTGSDLDLSGQALVAPIGSLNDGSCASTPGWRSMASEEGLALSAAEADA